MHGVVPMTMDHHPAPFSQHGGAVGAIDAQRARPRMLWPVRPRYSGHVPTWVWLAVLGLCFAAALPVVRAATVTESASELQQLETDRARLQSEIRSLAAHVGQLGSLARVQEQAEERLNMVLARPTAVLEVSISPPARTLPTRFLPHDSDHSASGKTPSRDLTNWQVIADLLILE